MAFKENITKCFSEFTLGKTLNTYEKAKSNISTMKREFREHNNEEDKNI